MNLISEEVDGILILTLNRPTKHHAIDASLALALGKAFEMAKHNSSIYVVVVTSTGPVFCAGADLGKLIPLRTGRPPETPEEVEMTKDFSGSLDRALLRGLDVGKPVVCAMQGSAFAGGFELALNCDMRVAVKGTVCALPEVTRGLLAAGGGTSRLSGKVGHALAMEMLLTGQAMSVERLHTVGFVNVLVDHADQALPAAMTLARAIVKNSPTAVRLTRQSIQANHNRHESDALQIESIFATQNMMSSDAIEGPLSFMERRSPIWSKL